jgi:hypothetical protein
MGSASAPRAAGVSRVIRASVFRGPATTSQLSTQHARTRGTSSICVVQAGYLRSERNRKMRSKPCTPAITESYPIHYMFKW